MSRIAAVVLSLALSLAGCASTPEIPEGAQAIRPGDQFGFQGRSYRFIKVADDYVLLRNVPAEGETGELSGYHEEVFRVRREDLGRGRWHMHPKLPGCYLQWRGGDDFAVACDPGPVAGEKVTVIE